MLAAAEEVMRNGGAVVVGAEAGHPVVDHLSQLNSLVTAVALSEISLKIFSLLFFFTFSIFRFVRQ